MARTKHENRTLFDFLQYDESVQWVEGEEGICMWSYNGKDYVAIPMRYGSTGTVPVWQREGLVVVIKGRCKPSMTMGKVYQSLR